MNKLKVGSICSGIEAASVAWSGLNFEFDWFSEISDFPSKLLKLKYPNVPNLGDMCNIPDKLSSEEIPTPDLICGGTPCQAFSLAGWKKGLEDSRGNLTLKFVDIINENDKARSRKKLPQSMILWENVEGVLNDRTNAFGIFLASLAGLDTEVSISKWPKAGLIRGPKRNIAWRVLDAKYFGLPQQRKRLYVLGGGKDFYPENILFDSFSRNSGKAVYENQCLSFEKQGHNIEVFRSYTDCLYSAYGTKWNGNAAAYNGSLFVAQNGRLRRVTPLECERLMGFPDNYTNIPKAKPTNRYQGIGNSWAVPVITWLGKRIYDSYNCASEQLESKINEAYSSLAMNKNYDFFDISRSYPTLDNPNALNGSEKPEHIKIGNIFDAIDTEASENFYISPVGCKGILRRKQERKLTINSRLEFVLSQISSTWSDEDIEKVSRQQSRGRFSTALSGFDEVETQ